MTIKGQRDYAQNWRLPVFRDNSAFMAELDLGPAAKSITAQIIQLLVRPNGLAPKGSTK
jgi:hypothetical protein